MTTNSRDELRELLNNLPLDSRQKEVLNRGIDNMTPERASKCLKHLTKALTTDHQAIREAVRLYKEAREGLEKK